MKLVMIEWVDPCAYAVHGWMDKENNDDECMNPIPCITVGILYSENSERLVVVLNMNRSNFCQAQSIPKCAIKRMRVLTCKLPGSLYHSQEGNGDTKDNN